MMGVGGAPSGTAVPYADVKVDLSRSDGPGLEPVGLHLVVEGPPGAIWDDPTRTARIVNALRDPGGPIAYGARNALWQVAQARAFSTLRDAGAIITEEDVVAALERATSTVVGGLPGVPPAPPAVDIETLLLQSVEGMVERNLGWLDDYLLGIDGLPGLEGACTWVADLVTNVTLAALAASWDGDLPVVTGDDLEALVTHGTEVISELRQALAAEGGRVLDTCLEALGEALPLVPDSIMEFMAPRLSTMATVVALLGLDCAQASLVTIGLLGCQVELDRAEEVGGVGGLDGISLRFSDLTATTGWSGGKACEPPGLMEGLAVALLSGGDGPEVGLGTLPFASSCVVRVRGTATVVARAMGASGRPLSASWTVPVDLGWEVVLATGGALEGVSYAPSATLAGDAARAVDSVLTGGNLSVGWLTARFRDAAELVGTWAEGLYEDMVRSVMTESAYTLSRALWRIGESLADRKMDRALNGTWDLLMDLFGDDLREALTWETRVMGMDLVVAFDPARQQVDVGLTSGRVSLDLSARRLCDPHPPFKARPIEGFGWGVFGEARLDLGERGAVLYLDPLTLERDSVLTLEISWGDGGSGGELVLEALEARRLKRGWSISLSEVSGAGWLLSMAGGGVVDAGLAVHGDLMEEGAARKALERAMKAAWLATMRGWKVGDLVGGTGKGPDAATFVETLLRELHAALVEEGGKLVSEVEVFVEVAFPAPGWPDVRLSLVLCDPLEALLPLLAWARRSLEPLVGAALSGSVERARDAMGTWLMEHVLLRFELAWAIGPPSWLASRTGVDLPDTMGLVVRGQVNAAALGAVGGMTRGRWEGSLEISLRGVPGSVLALVPGMGSTEWKWAEVTLLRASVREMETTRLLITQVHYDAKGNDVDLEYVELMNAGDGMLDLDGFQLRDNDGTFTIRGHHPLLPGDHLLVARNSSALRGVWHVLPDVGRMGLRLANDGDVVTIVDPEGEVLDMVAWEGHMEGWEDLEAGEGLALLRREGDWRACQRSAWYVGVPSPRRTGW